jgi:hypothetical protein
VFDVCFWDLGKEKQREKALFVLFWIILNILFFVFKYLKFGMSPWYLLKCKVKIKAFIKKII